jgi:hypothetical protein
MSNKINESEAAANADRELSDANQKILQALEDAIVPLEYIATIGPQAAYNILVANGLEHVD